MQALIATDVMQCAERRHMVVLDEPTARLNRYQAAVRQKKLAREAGEVGDWLLMRSCR